jgi:hypothetical protein
LLGELHLSDLEGLVRRFHTLAYETPIAFFGIVFPIESALRYSLKLR